MWEGVINLPPSVSDWPQPERRVVTQQDYDDTLAAAKADGRAEEEGGSLSGRGLIGIFLLAVQPPR